MKYRWLEKGRIRKGNTVGWGYTQADAEARLKRQHPNIEIRR